MLLRERRRADLIEPCPASQAKQPPTGPRFLRLKPPICTAPAGQRCGPLRFVLLTRGCCLARRLSAVLCRPASMGSPA